MSDSALDMLLVDLARTEAQEMDCDEFRSLLPELVEGSITDPKVRTLIEHHRAICAECEEERAMLEKVLG